MHVRLSSVWGWLFPLQSLWLLSSSHVFKPSEDAKIAHIQGLDLCKWWWQPHFWLTSCSKYSEQFVKVSSSRWTWGTGSEAAWLAKQLKRSRIFLQCRRCRFSPWVGNIPWSSIPILLFLPGTSHGQRSLVGYINRVARSCRHLSTQHVYIHTHNSKNKNRPTPTEPFITCWVLFQVYCYRYNLS